MRLGVMLGAGMALMSAGGAWAQMGHPGAPYPMPGQAGPGVHHPPMPPAPRMMPHGGQRWGSRIGGHWWGGVNAPGGWAAYRRPFRGYRLPGYWIAPRFYITDWQNYGLAQPWGGYTWVRYYDDAVLVDGHGQVYDWRGGIDWDGAPALDGAYADGAYADQGPPPPPPGGYHDGPPPPMPPHGYRERREVIVRDGHGPYGPGPQVWSSGDGRTTVTTTVTGGAAPVIVTPGYGYGASVTTVTIQSAPVVTTTTTEVVEDAVTYTRHVVRPVVRRRVWRPRPCPPPRPRWHRPPAVRGS